MDNAEHVALLKDFGTLLGLDLEFDAAGMCVLMIDQTMLSIRSFNELLILYGMLGDFPDDRPAGFWKHLLAINNNLVEVHRGAIAFDESSDAVLLMQSVDAKHMQPDALYDLVTVFVDQAQHLVDLLNEELPSSEIDVREPANTELGFA